MPIESFRLFFFLFSLMPIKSDVRRDVNHVKAVKKAFTD